MSDDGAHALVVIALLGNPFSPRYARARARDAFADPLQHSAMNVALDGPRAQRWALTERGRGAVSRSAERLEIGKSAIARDANAITIDLDETDAPWGRPIRGRVTVEPTTNASETVALDAEARHMWTPHAPTARVLVELREPSLRFRGHGYVDENAGDEPLEHAFERWSWWRANVGGTAAIGYDVVRRDGSACVVSRAIGRDGIAVPRTSSSRVDLAPTRWRLARPIAAVDPRVLRTIADTPFYARTLVDASFDGIRATAMHETMSLSRLRARWVQFLLPFKMRSVA